jgi:hypothetical protein
VIVQLLLASLFVCGSLAFIAWPLFNGVDEREVDAERAELEDAKRAKYREIKDAELDFKAGRMTEEQWAQTDRELRREAMLILRRIDMPAARVPAAGRRSGASGPGETAERTDSG